MCDLRRSEARAGEGAVRRKGGIFLRRAGLEMDASQMADKRRIQRIHPDHTAFGAFMHMLVPGHGGRNYQIADLHRTALAVNDGGRTFSPGIYI